MPAIDFPNSPLVNDTFVAAGKTWIWTGTVWNIVPEVITPGHEVLDGNGSPLTQEPQLQFVRLNVTAGAGKTVVTRPPDTFIGTTPPSNPVEGDVWTDSTDTEWKTYVRYDGYWIERSVPGTGSTGQSGLAANLFLYYNFY